MIVENQNSKNKLAFFIPKNRVHLIINRLIRTMNNVWHFQTKIEQSSINNVGLDKNLDRVINQQNTLFIVICRDMDDWKTITPMLDKHLDQNLYMVISQYLIYMYMHMQGHDKFIIKLVQYINTLHINFLYTYVNMATKYIVFIEKEKGNNFQVFNYL